MRTDLKVRQNAYLQPVALATSLNKALTTACLQWVNTQGKRLRLVDAKDQVSFEQLKLASSTAKAALDSTGGLMPLSHACRLLAGLLHISQTSCRRVPLHLIWLFEHGCNVEGSGPGGLGWHGLVDHQPPNLMTSWRGGSRGRTSLHLLRTRMKGMWSL